MPTRMVARLVCLTRFGSTAAIWVAIAMAVSSNAADETTRLTITWSKQADLALRSYLGAHGMKKGDISKFIEEAVRWRIFHQTVGEAREAFYVDHRSYFPAQK